MLRLPLNFISTIKNVFGADGEKFIANLPKLVEEASQRWGLRNVQPVSNLSYNFVAYATSPSPLAPLPKGEGNVVLKIGVPRGELTSEMAALGVFDAVCRDACGVKIATASGGRLLFLVDTATTSRSGRGSRRREPATGQWSTIQEQTCRHQCIRKTTTCTNRKLSGVTKSSFHTLLLSKFVRPRGRF